MKATSVAIVILAVLCVGLTGVTVATVGRNRELNQQLEQPVAGRPSPLPSSSTEQLRQLLEAKELAYLQLQDEYKQYKREHAEGGMSETEMALSPNGTGATTNAPAPSMDRLRETDPERYRQMTEQREQRRKQMDEWYRDQMTKLDARAQSAQSQQEAEVAGQIADTLAKLNELRNEWSALRDMTEDQRRVSAEELQTQMREAYRTLNELRDLDRQIQFGNLARSVGYTDPKAIQGFVDAITGIYQNTQYNIGRGPGRGGRGGQP